MLTQTEHLITTAQNPVVISDYEKLQNDIVIAQKEAQSVSFDYHDAKGNKDARSYVYGLRKLRAEIERKRKAAKSYFIEGGKRIDATAKELESQVDELILPHETEIKAIEHAEEQRKAKHRAVIDRIVEVRTANYREGLTSSDVATLIDEVDRIDTSGLEEFASEANAEIIHTGKVLREVRQKLLASEEEARELAKLREEQARREQEDRDRRLAEEAAEKARQEEAAKAKAEREEEERRHREEIEARERAELKAQADKERAEREKVEAQQRAERLEREEAERQKLAEEKAQREAKAAKERRAEAIKRIQASLELEGIGHAYAEDAASLIVDGKIDLVQVNWSKL